MIGVPEALELAESVPQVLPLHPAPLNVHVTPLFCPSFETVAVKLCVSPTFTVAVAGATATEIAGATVIVAAPLCVASVTDVAVNVTVAGDGTAAGGVYVIATPDALEADESVPHVAPLHPAPVNAHVTPWFSRSFETVAAKLCVSPKFTVAVNGATATEIAGTTVIVEEKLRVPSATEVALIVTVAGEGTAAGAV